MAQNDLETFHIDENKFTISSKNQAKHKRKIHTKAFTELKIQQSNHSKMKDIIDEKFACQEYLIKIN